MRNSKRGISILELLVAAALAGVLALVVSSAFVKLLESNRRLEKSLQNRVAYGLVQQVVERDVRGAGLMTGTSPALDSVQGGVCEFFDYLTVGKCLVTAPCGCSRRLEIRNVGEEMVLVVQDTDSHPVMLNPFAHYTRAADPEVVNFRGPGDVRTALVAANVDVSVDQLLLFYSPTYSMNPRGFAKRTSYMMKAIATDLANTPATAYLDLVHPRAPAIRMDSLDTFLRTLVPIGASKSLAMVRAVRVVKYSISANGGAGNRDRGPFLLRQVWMNDRFGPPQVLAGGIRSLRLVRDNITSPAISYLFEQMPQ